MKRTLIIFGAILLIFSLVHSKYLLSAGFTPRKITYGGPYNIQNEIDNPLNAKCLYILENEFTYLGKGAQTYVFESSDKKYVIKFIRFHKYRIPFWGEILNYIHLYPKNIEKTMNAKKNRYKLVMKSYKIAYNFLSDFTQVEYLHLNQTDFFNKKIIVRDKSSRKHVVDLDKVAFIIQRKLNPFSEVMHSAIKNDEKENVYKSIDSFFDCLSFLAKNKLVNRDYPNMLRNSGFLDQKYVMADVGSFFNVPEGKNDYLKEQFFNFSNSLKAYLEKSGPDYLPFFENRLQKEISCLSL